MNAEPCVILAAEPGERKDDIQALGELCRGLYQASLIFLVEKVQPGDDDVTGHLWAPSLAIENVDAALKALCLYLASGDWKVLELPLSATYLRLQALCAELHHGWQRDLATVTFALVAHISLDVHLSPPADALQSQPRHRRGAASPSLDERTRSKMLAEVAKVMYQGLDTDKQLFFTRILPKALHGFAAEERSRWEAILMQLGILEGDALLNDMLEASRGRKMVRLLRS
ncbi:diiron oxygenase [Pseudomonas gingeri]|uniref:Diiron oxygenase n=1 Tax=Pseudomonas gingeri TaxID=117681 RepID=A0A7Y7XE34_9PSED|nr:diiron oxygenase [Pseudomonas gingeri]NWB97989.1 diiron oxygenase [Pseudomonas gingeri]